MSAVSGVGSTTGTDAVQDVTGTASRLANQDIFMQLLVAQLKYQNPMNPADGVEFMTQLTQFSQLEQMLSIRKGVDSMTEMISSMSADTRSGGETEAP
jgi:flagellar basal-body rod modification protein FlgD